MEVGAINPIAVCFAFGIIDFLPSCAELQFTSCGIFFHRSIEAQSGSLITPFAITTKGFGITSQTAKAEQAYIVIESIFPDFFWPEKAEVTAYVNDVAVMSEVMTITPSGREKQVFNASIKDTYYDLTLENGDTLEIVLVVTDNLGRTEQFTTESMSVQDGELQRKPAAAPVAPIGN